MSKTPTQTKARRGPYRQVSKPAAGVARAIDVVMACLIGLVFVLAVVVFAARAFGVSFAWQGEVAKFAFLWAGMLGTAVGMAADRHVGLTWLSTKLSPGPRRWLARLNLVICIVVLAVLIFYSLRVINSFVGQNTSAILEIPASWEFASLVVASLVGGWFLIERLFRRSAASDASEDLGE